MKLPRGVVTTCDCYTTGPMHTSPPQGEKQVNSLNKRQGQLSTTYRFVTQEALRIHPSWSCSLRTLWPNSGHKPLKSYYWKDWFGLYHLICNATLNTVCTREQRSAHHCIIMHSCGKLQSVMHAYPSHCWRPSPTVRESWPPYELHQHGMRAWRTCRTQYAYNWSLECRRHMCGMYKTGPRMENKVR